MLYIRVCNSIYKYISVTKKFVALLPIGHELVSQVQSCTPHNLLQAHLLNFDHSIRSFDKISIFLIFYESAIQSGRQQHSLPRQTISSRKLATLNLYSSSNGRQRHTPSCNTWS